MRNRSSFTLAVAAALALSALGARAEADPKKVERTWKSKCASCHGLAGKGDTEMGKKNAIEDYTTDAWQKGKKDDELKNAILNGIKREKGGVKQEMDAYKEKGIDDEMAAGLVKHVRSLKK